MTDVIKFFTRRQGKKKASLTDWISYGFLVSGLFNYISASSVARDEFYQVAIPASKIRH
jgi:hypothetical protein